MKLLSALFVSGGVIFKGIRNVSWVRKLGWGAAPVSRMSFFSRFRLMSARLGLRAPMSLQWWRLGFFSLKSLVPTLPQAIRWSISMWFFNHTLNLLHGIALSLIDDAKHDATAYARLNVESLSQFKSNFCLSHDKEYVEAVLQNVSSPPWSTLKSILTGVSAEDLKWFAILIQEVGARYRGPDDVESIHTLVNVMPAWSDKKVIALLGAIKYYEATQVVNAVDNEVEDSAQPMFDVELGNALRSLPPVEEKVSKKAETKRDQLLNMVDNKSTRQEVKMVKQNEAPSALSLASLGIKPQKERNLDD